MNGRTRIATAVLALALAAPAAGQQALSGQSAVVRVEGLERVLESLQRVEVKLDRLLLGRWEYRTVQRKPPRRRGRADRGARGARGGSW